MDEWEGYTIALETFPFPGYGLRYRKDPRRYERFESEKLAFRPLTIPSTINF